MGICFNAVHSRRVGVAFLALGILGMLARNYVAGFQRIGHGDVVDFSFGLLFGLGIALCFVTNSHESEESPNSILPS